MSEEDSFKTHPQTKENQEKKLKNQIWDWTITLKFIFKIKEKQKRKWLKSSDQGSTPGSGTNRHTKAAKTMFL